MDSNIPAHWVALSDQIMSESERVMQEFVDQYRDVKERNGIITAQSWLAVELEKTKTTLDDGYYFGVLFGLVEALIEKVTKLEDELKKRSDDE